MTFEYCCDCGEATGRAGRGDDSIYCDDCDRGPFCVYCRKSHKHNPGRHDQIKTLESDLARLESASKCPCCKDGTNIEGQTCQECHGTGSLEVAYESCRVAYKLQSERLARLDGLLREIEEHEHIHDGDACLSRLPDRVIDGYGFDDGKQVGAMIGHRCCAAIAARRKQASATDTDAGGEVNR